MTKNLTPGTAVYGEKRISVDGPAAEDGTVTKQEYRVWNPFRSKVNFPLSPRNGCMASPAIISDSQNSFILP